MTTSRELAVEPLLFHLGRSQLRWFLWLGCLLGGAPGQNQNPLEGLYIPSDLGSKPHSNKGRNT